MQESENNFPKKRANFARILAILAVFATILLTIFTRLQSLDDPHLLEFDTMYFHNKAEEIIRTGELSSSEIDRYYPLIYDGGDYHVPTYSIAFLCKINPFCLSTFEGVKSASKWYAPIFTILTVIILAYLGYRAGKDWFIGALLFAIVPGAIFRSVAGFTDKDTAAFFFMTLSVYFVYRYVQEERIGSILIFGSFAGLSMGLAALSLSSYVLYVAPVLFFMAVQVFRYKVKANVLGTIPFVLFPVLMRLWYGNTGGLVFAKSTLNLAIYGATAFPVIAYLFFRYSERILPKKKLSNGALLGLSLATTLAIGFAIIAATGNNPVETVSSIVLQFSNPLRYSIHGGTVGENQPTSWAFPWEPAFARGANTYWLQLGLVFALSLGIFAALFFSKRDEDLLTACFLAFNLYAASRGVRLFVSLAPIAAFAAGQAISSLYRNSKNKSASLIFGGILVATGFLFAGFSKEPILVYIFLGLAGVALAIGAISRNFPQAAPKWAAAFIVLAIFVQLYPTVLSSASGIRTSVNSEWFENFKWSDQNLAKESPVLAWWDYGYWIQYFARRPSVADGGNRILKTNQELGLMFTDSDEDRAADWMTTMHYPIVTLTLSKGDKTYEYSNEVYAEDFYPRFLPEKTLIKGECVGDNPGTRQKTCSGYSVDLSSLPEGEYSAKLLVNYREVYSGREGQVQVPETEEIRTVPTGPITYFNEGAPSLERVGDGTRIEPYIRAEGGKLIFGYSPFENELKPPRLMTHDSTMIGKMAAASSIGLRPVQYAVFPYLRDSDTPLGKGRIYSSGGYFIAIVDQNGTALPLIGASGQAGAAVLSSIATYDGVFETNSSGAQMDSGSAILLPGAAIYATEGGDRNIFTRTYILDGAGTERFREVFSNGFAKSFYVI